MSDDEHARLTAEANRIRAECEKDLSAALPILNQSISALDCLKMQDIAVLRKMANPSDKVKRVFGALALMFELPEDWHHPQGAKHLLHDVHLLDKLKSFDKDGLKPETVEALKSDKYLKHADFTPEAVKRASSAASALCLWVIGIVQYHDVSMAIQPKREALQQAEARLAELKGESASPSSASATAAAAAKPATSASAKEEASPPPRAPPTAAEIAVIKKAATEALDHLSKAELNEVRSFAHPPADIIAVVDVVLTLLGRPVGWHEGKRALSEASFLNDLKHLDVGAIPAETITAARERCGAFSADTLLRKSRAIAGLFQWAEGVCNLWAVLEIEKGSGGGGDKPQAAAAVKPTTTTSEEAGGMTRSASHTVEDLKRHLGHLNKGELSELVNFVKPPTACVKVAGCIALVMGKPAREAEDWFVAKAVLKDPKTLQALQDYDVSTVGSDLVAKLAAKVEEIDAHALQHQSHAAAVLYAWLHDLVHICQKMQADPARRPKISRDAAVKAVNALNKRDVQALKAFAHPPTCITEIVDVMLLMLGRPTGWHEGKQFLADGSSLQVLAAFDPTKITDDAAAAAAERLSHLTLDQMKRASAAGASFFIWAEGMLGSRHEAPPPPPPSNNNDDDDDDKKKPADDGAKKTETAAPAKKPAPPPQPAAAVAATASSEDADKAHAAAAKALGQIKPMHLSELKMLASPPAVVVRVFDVLLVLLEQPTGWAEGKKLLGVVDFIDQLKNYDVRAASAEAIADAADRLKGFTAMDAKRAATVAALLYEWATNIVNFRLILDALEQRSRKTD